METSFNSQEQQRLAKLNLLVLDDDYERNQDIQCSFQNDQWGRSVQTQTFLREKLSQRYKLKRKSQQQSRIKPSFRQSLQQKNKLTDKQSLKDILRKLDSKEIGTSRQQVMRKSMLSQNYRFSKQRDIKSKYSSNKTTIDYQHNQDRSFRKVLGGSVNSKGENNFVLKKMEIMSVKKINRTHDETMQGPFMEVNTENYGKKREFFTDCKHTRRFKNRIRKNTQNKQNQVVEFTDNPVDFFRGTDQLKRKLFNCNSIVKAGSNNIVENEDINKRTFQILQEINRTKSINLGKSMNFGSNNISKNSDIKCDALKLKRDKLVPYSKVLKQKSNCMSKQKRSQNSRLIMRSKDNIWVKLQIRG